VLQTAFAVVAVSVLSSGRPCTRRWWSSTRRGSGSPTSLPGRRAGLRRCRRHPHGDSAPIEPPAGSPMPQLCPASCAPGRQHPNEGPLPEWTATW